MWLDITNKNNTRKHSVHLRHFVCEHGHGLAKKTATNNKIQAVSNTCLILYVLKLLLNNASGNIY